MTFEFKLKKLSGRRRWTSNIGSAEPASWMVKGPYDIYLIGHSGAVPYYELFVGGQFDGMTVSGSKSIRTLYLFKDAKKAAKAEFDRLNAPSWATP